MTTIKPIKDWWKRFKICLVVTEMIWWYNQYGEPAICQCCKMSMMQNDNDAKCQWYIYVNVAKCQCLQNANIKNRKCSTNVMD